MAGSLARTVAQATIHPLDTIKTRCQVSVPTPAVVQARELALAGAPSRATSHIRSGGLLRLPVKTLTGHVALLRGTADVYRGLSGAVFGMLPSAFVYFLTYERCKRRLQRALPDHGPAVHLVSASAGAAVSSLIKVPADIVKHRVQACLNPNVADAACSIVRSQGVAGLYAGFGLQLLRDVPEIVIQFAIYDCLHRELLTWRSRSSRTHSSATAAAPVAAVMQLQPTDHLLLGAVSGAAAAGATMPLDVLKTSMQCGVAGARTSAPAALRHVLRHKGVEGLFAGLLPRVAQTSVMSAVFFMSFEMLKGRLNCADAGSTAAVATAGAADLQHQQRQQQHRPGEESATQAVAAGLGNQRSVRFRQRPCSIKIGSSSFDALGTEYLLGIQQQERVIDFPAFQLAAG